MTGMADTDIKIEAIDGQEWAILSPITVTNGHAHPTTTMAPPPPSIPGTNAIKHFLLKQIQLFYIIDRFYCVIWHYFYSALTMKICRCKYRTYMPRECNKILT